MKARSAVALVIGSLVGVAAVSWLVRGGSDESPAREPGATGVPHAGMSEVAVSVDREIPMGIPLDSLSVVITYDNNPYAEGLRTEWGFSCLVRGPDKTILFDTGGEGEVLMANMAALGLDPRAVDVIVLSHAHRDHTGGLSEFLKSNPDVAVYVPRSFDEGFKRRPRGLGAEVIEVGDAVPICENVYSTGEMGSSIREQAMFVVTDRGIVVVTGCAHPGIVSMVEKAKALSGDDVLLVFGGFHLVRAGDREIADVIAGLKQLGVQYAAPCHCSGDAARKIFSEQFGTGYIALGVGRSLTATDLK